MIDPPAQRAKVPINIIIIGGGITGLSCAYTLSEAGHSVHVLEAENVFESSAGIHSPPNMTRILFRWGLGPDILAQTKGRCPKIVFNSACTGVKMGEVLFHKEVMDELGGEMYSLRHSDLVHSLHKLALGAGAQISFGARVVNIDTSAASVTLESGRNLQADLIVGADGHRSVVRSCLPLVRRDCKNVDYTTYLTTIPVSKFIDDSEILELLEDPKWYMWMGSGWGACTFGIRNNTALSVTVFRDEKCAGEHADWKKQIPAKDLGLEGLELAPVLTRIMSLAETAVRVKNDRSRIPENLFDGDGHVVVVGEAAHGSIVGSVHTAAMGIEDAAVLGRMFSKLKSRSEIKRFLSAFQEIRHPRDEQLCASEQQKVDFIALPTGPESEARDKAMSLQMVEGQTDWSGSEDGFLQKSWEEFRSAFGYDAYDEADTWWVEWGVLFDRMDATNSEDVSSDDPFKGQIIVEREQHSTGPIF